MRCRFALALSFSCSCAYGVAPAEKPTADAGADAALTIVQLRNPSDPAHPALGSDVVVRDAVVTDVKTTGTSHGFFAQDPVAASWAGVYVFVGPEAPPVERGDVVRVSGVYSTYVGLEEIDARAGSIEKTGTHEIPDDMIVSLNEIEPDGFRTLALQSMLVRVQNVFATSDTAGGDFTLGDLQSGAAITVTSYMANDTGPSPFPAYQGEPFAEIIGHVYVDGVPELAPMSAGDLITQ